MMEQSISLLAPVLPLTAQRTVKRALTLLDRHLRETGMAFTSTQAARDWLKLKMAGLEREEFMVLYSKHCLQVLLVVPRYIPVRWSNAPCISMQLQ